DLAAADRYVELLLDQSAQHGIGLWHAWALCSKGVLSVRRGDEADGLRALRAILNEVPEIRLLPRYLALLGHLAMAVGQAGDAAQGLEIINGALDRSQRHHEQWCLAELLRIKGELTLLGGAPNAAEAAEADFRSSLDWASRQSALSWELRTTTSLARLYRDQDRAGETRDLLASVYGRFTEGFETADLIAAGQLLSELSVRRGAR